VTLEPHTGHITARTSPAPAAGTPVPAGRRSRRFGVAVLGVAALATAGALAVGVASSRADATVLTNCAPTLTTCGYPGATNTGVPGGTVLKTVPSQVSSGPGWYYNAAGNDVVVNVNGTVLSGLYIPYTLEIDASNVTVSNVQVVTGGNYGVSLRHTTGVTIQNSLITGQNATSGRVNYAIDDVYGDSTGMVIKNNNISNFRTAIQMSTGLVDSNYIHDPGFVAGDHTNGIYVGGGTQPMTIQNNTILDSQNQTDAINLDAASSGVSVANKTVKNNLLGGGSYTIYGGAALGDPTSNLVIQNNRFSQQYFAQGGQYGPVAYFDPTGPGNVWSGNIWDTSAQTVTSS